MRKTIITIATVVLLVGGFLVGIASMMIAADHDRSDLVADIAFGQVEGHEVVLVPYESSGVGGLRGVSTHLAVPYTLRVAAVDLDTGDLLWDKLLDRDWPVDEGSALAGGARFAYVATDGGLVILDITTGRVHAREGDISGLEGAYIASRTAYAYDEADRVVVMLAADGRVLTIPLDGDTATLASSAVSERWANELNLPDPRGSRAPFDVDQDASVKSATLPDGEEVSLGWFGGDANRHVIIDLATGMAAGADHGFLVTETQKGTAVHYGLLDPRTGEPGQSVTARHTITTARVSPGGTVVVLTGDQDLGVLVIATPEEIRRVVVGDTNYWGWRA